MEFALGGWVGMIEGTVGDELILRNRQCKFGAVAGLFGLYDWSGI